jgi:hypothetical protein
MIKFSSTLDLLIKFAKLTDEQYKATLRDSNKLKQLEDNSLLDDFYKARPDKTENELSEEQSFRKSLKEESKISIKNPKVMAFIKSFGMETVPIDIIFRVVKSTIRTESLEEDEMKDLMEHLRSHTLKDIIELFYKNVKHSDNSLLTFINDYENLDILEDKKRQAEKGMELFSLSDNQNLDYLKAKVADDLFLVLDQINKISPLDINLPIEDVMFNKLEESLNLRNSNIFDFIYNPSEELKAS